MAKVNNQGVWSWVRAPIDDRKMCEIDSSDVADWPHELCDECHGQLSGGTPGEISATYRAPKKGRVCDCLDWQFGRWFVVTSRLVDCWQTSGLTGLEFSRVRIKKNSPELFLAEATRSRVKLDLVASKATMSRPACPSCGCQGIPLRASGFHLDDEDLAACQLDVFRPFFAQDGYIFVNSRFVDWVRECDLQNLHFEPLNEINIDIPRNKWEKLYRYRES